MVLKALVIFYFALSTVEAFDFVRQSFSIVDENTDPCDNFYRHACPLDPFRGDQISTLYEETLTNLLAKQKDSFWENLEIESVLKNAKIKELPDFNEFVADVFSYRCDKRYNTYAFLKQVEYLILGEKQCRQSECLTALAGDQNCTRAAQILRNRITRNVSGPIENAINRARGNIYYTKKAVRAVSAIMDGKLQNGVNIVKILVQRMVAILNVWIEKTPWAVNNGVVDAIQMEINQLHHDNNYADVLRKKLDYLTKLERNYLKCYADLDGSENENIFCALSALAKTPKSGNSNGGSFFNDNNAVNYHPFVSFGFPYYDMAQNVDEYAAMLGVVGECVGHEVAHTLIENANDLEMLPVFSKESTQCITSQFNKTCEAFRETSCSEGDTQLEENGADILGHQLAYSIFEEHYQGRLQEEYITLKTRKVTMQQLFFYAFAFSFCEGERGEGHPKGLHSANNIRVNFVAQHPAFQEAFQCSPDSAMMQSVDKECIIFGKNAPETRRRFNSLF